MHLAAHPAFRGLNGSWIDAQIEQHGVDPTEPDRFKSETDARSTDAFETTHEGAVEKHEIGHGNEAAESGRASGTTRRGAEEIEHVCCNGKRQRHSCPGRTQF